MSSLQRTYGATDEGFYFFLIADMLIAPPEVVATWPEPNYVNPEHQGPHLMIIVITSFTISSIVVGLRTPLSDYWTDPYRRSCINNGARIISGSIPHVLTDIIIWMLPIPTLCKMHLPGREKVVLIILMSFGLIACAASVVRLAYTYVILYVSYDSTWVGYNLWLWNDLEVNLAVICASAPVLRPLARMYLPNWGSNVFTTSANSLPTEAQPSGQKQINLVLPDWKGDEESIRDEKKFLDLPPISGLDEKIDLKLPEKARHPIKQQRE
ncbi:conserved hypothetical protein [Microsporum canis CBS 113480]|uniref:Rhodopsin domain-containing protein n=1 Tax=Arthroderma otae (strain ATCC MYA-4605 / CBS 113480) TaxID=554155 RepID=C5FSN7_ARTOC|nr:conserved hypothetical protein [Microsporum canis CBS 113480]EEQ32890.1 conserved hypothetical protein [Microsporum canis CBS 113480]